MKLLSWNVNGYRSALSKGLHNVLKKESPDIFCLQESKISSEQFAELAHLDNYHYIISPALKKGYSGVITGIKKAARYNPKKVTLGIGIKKFDSEGRFIFTEHSGFTLLNTYFPSGTSGDHRQSFKYEFLDALYSFLKKRKIRNLVICGDFNICHKEIDIHHPDKATRLGLTGFLPNERAWMDSFTELGFVDTFRHINGDIKSKYTWWSYRAGSRGKNLGWRIDYFFVSTALSKKVKDAKILSSVPGSDHCPITLELKK